MSCHPLSFTLLLFFLAQNVLNTSRCYLSLLPYLTNLVIFLLQTAYIRSKMTLPCFIFLSIIQHNHPLPYLPGIVPGLLAPLQRLLIKQKQMNTFSFTVISCRPPTIEFSLKEPLGKHRSYPLRNNSQNDSILFNRES